MTKRTLAEKLITLAYRIEPQLKTDLNEYVQGLLNKQAQVAANEATVQLLAHQQRAARIAMLQ